MIGRPPVAREAPMGRQNRPAAHSIRGIRCAAWALTAQGFVSCRRCGCELTRGDLLEPASLGLRPWRVRCGHRRRHGPRHRDNHQHLHVRLERQAFNLYQACGRRRLKRFVFVRCWMAEKHRSVPLDGDQILDRAVACSESVFF